MSISIVRPALGQVNSKVTTAVVTGGGHGIGRAICRRLYRDGVRVVVADIDGAAAQAVADDIDGVAKNVDVGDEAAIAALVEQVEAEVGPIDMFVSNAGVGFGDGPEGAISRQGRIGDVQDRWEACWRVNVMAQVYAARALVPRMLARGGGHLINIASAAGLLSQIGDAAYSTTKHAAVGFAEALAIDYGDRGIKVSVVCPQAVATRMIGIEDDSDSTEGGFGGNDVDGIMSADEVAGIIVNGSLAGRFLILTHPEVATYFQRKASDHDRWIAGMQRFQKKLLQSS